MLTMIICAHRVAGNTLDWPSAKAAADEIRSRGVEVTYAIFPNSFVPELQSAFLGST